MESGRNRVFGSSPDLRIDIWAECGVPSSECILPLFVEHSRSNLEQKMRSALAPSHLLLLHHPFADDLIDNLSDENVVAHWVENPYWQHFSGGRFFQHRAPIDASSMTRWRQRLGEAGAEQMLRATIETGIAMGAIRPAQLKRRTLHTQSANA